MYDFTPFLESIRSYLDAHLGYWGANLVVWTLVVLIFLGLYSVLGLVLVYVERRICAFFQLRLGPNRVGWAGTLQTVADAIKLLLKEPVTINKADKLLFNLAPFIISLAAIMVLGMVPFAKGLQAFDINIGLLFIIAISSIGVVGILLAGWSSNNKYALIGAMRSGAQIVSYELSVGLSLLTMVLLTGTLQLSGIIEGQATGWWIFRGHISAVAAFFLYLTASIAEINRGPFDLPEAESELTAGFHTEYSGLKFAFFFLAEFVNMFTVAAIATTVFLGGWMPFHIGHWEAFNQVMDWLPPIVWFLLKVSAVIFLIMWFKWTFPRLRIDQLLHLEWKYLMPLNLLNLIFMAILVYMGWHF